ncbi:MAG: PilW family protein, partial [Woeseiaceae bacterium]
LVLVGGTIQVFTGNRATYEFTDDLARIQENARFALDQITYDARMAGYKGCLADVAVFNNLTIANTFRDDIENGLVGHNANGTGAGQVFAATAKDPAPSADTTLWTPALPSELSGLVIPGSDVLIVRSISGPTNTMSAPFSSSTGLFVPNTHGYVAGEILVATDCQKASIFQLTGITAGSPNDQLGHTDSAGFVPGNAAAAWGPDQSYGLGGEVARLEAHAFFVGQGSNNRPSLFQLRLQWQSATQSDFVAEELVAGVDTMQVRYGLDTDNSGAPNSWVSADGVADWADVLSAEITLLVRADGEYGTDVDAVVYNLADTQYDPVDDRRLRQVFSTSVGVRNRLP